MLTLSFRKQHIYNIKINRNAVESKHKFAYRSTDEAAAV